MTNAEKQPIIKKCIGCSNIEGEVCRVWFSPATKWRTGNCPSATHIKRELSEPEQKVRVGQQKQKKKLG